MPHPVTGLIHHAYRPPEGFAAPQAAVHKASTVFFPSVAAMRSFDWKDKSAYTYGLHGTPTTYTLEERLCEVEGGLQCLLVPSGLAAIATVALSLLRSGDEVLIPDNAYGPNLDLARGELQSWGITHQIYNAMDTADLAARINERTRLVWLEAAGSVTLEFPDLPEQVRICRSRGVWSALDNTWGAGIAFRPFDLSPDPTSQSAPLGVDVTVHALTKYPSGGGDVLMGSVVTRDPDLHLRLKLTHMRLGLAVAANDAESVLRSLPSLRLRYAAHDASAQKLARWCLSRTEFVQVLHPALESSPGHQNWKSLCAKGQEAGFGGAAGLFSVILDRRFEPRQVDRFCEALRLFKIGYSWGGPISLVLPYALKNMRPAWPTHLAHGTVVRFSPGLEDVHDLQADLAQALACLAS